MLLPARRSPLALNGLGAGLIAGVLLLPAPARLAPEAPPPSNPAGPYLVVLGVAQDGGVPQAGTKQHPGWTDPRFRRRVASLGLVDPASGRRWLIDATPDFREQLRALDEFAPVEGIPGVSGIFLSHAHMGHYVGLAHLGHESMGARDVPVHAMPRMRAFLRSSGPWSQLVEYGNIVLRPLEEAVPVRLTARLAITPFVVPHRQEYSEAVGFRIDGPVRSVLYLPDIDSWEDWEEMGERVEEWIASVDVAYLDGTFYSDGEIPGRDMSNFPHPFIVGSMRRFQALPLAEKAKVRFIHLNHTNPVLWPDTQERRRVSEQGFHVAREGERFDL